MLEDRSYMRKDPFGSRRSITFYLIVSLVAVFLVQNIILYYTPWAGRFRELFPLSNEGLSRGYVWQLFTFQFLHASPWPWHLLFNCLGLYFFGRSIEETLGGKNYLKLYFLSGMAGGLLQVLLNAVMPHSAGSVVGASAGVLGVLTAFALLFPEQEIMFWIMIFPVRLKAKYLLWISGILAIYGLLFPYDHIAHGAHLGGMLGGFAYLRWGAITENWFSRRAFRPRARPRAMAKVPFRKGNAWKSGANPIPEDLPPAEFISKEVDPILDKISAQGIQSLTPHEKRILEAARAKMEKR